MKTRLTKLLNIDLPILQGAMAWISESQLVSAVSNAGGAGVIATGGRDASWLDDEIRKTRELTNKPFGVNIVVLDSTNEEMVDLVCREKISFVTFGAGNPVPHIKKLKEYGIKVLPVVPNLKLAKRVEEAGADAVILEGMEAGGHIGHIATMAHMTNVIPNISIPVIIAGGIADGRGIAAALLMGAEGVQIGSRFLLAEECQIHNNYKNRIIEAQDTDSVITGYSTGHGVRGLKNTFSDEYIKNEFSGASADELHKIAMGTYKKAVVEGDIENGFVIVGQSVVPLNRIQSSKDIVDELIQETKDTLKNAVKFL
ncbi:nitronate monooxygenase [Serpentinicella alkaliphila]|uniref:Probable nitronate monooxygenase n=1 Tax=Serpentinicella alkaliphila TaxID=1734049 RepID=A0A4R2TSB9_9FIRM|nr:nitronate monooxygenase [Serpentinicella alkaliphila]QUH25675.1 nitronate monooxygenase [Serpentinicella alkaliphila]TCQ06611.1 enoyl-[acyl-carrier protein] reductase II [Serpentinicella alkaliphila]